MGFKKRIWISYIVLLLIISLVGGTSVIVLLMKQYEQDEFAAMERIASQTVSQVESQITIMQVAMDNILSNKEVVDSITYLSNNNAKNAYHSQCLWNITVSLNQWFYTKNFHRVLFYNPLGDRTATYNYREHRIDTELTLDQLPWLSEVCNRKGNPKLIAPRMDEWGVEDNVEVLSLVKEIQGKHMGFLEVQIKLEQLEEIFAGINENYQVSLYYEDEELIFSSSDTMDVWKNLCREDEIGAEIRKNPLTGAKELVCVSQSGANGLRVVLTGNPSIIWLKARYYIALTIISILMLLGVFFLYVSIISNKLSQPVIKLRKQIEEMNYLGEDGHFHLDENSDELGSFSNAFNQMIMTINELLLKDVEAEIQIQRSRVEKREMQLLYLRSQINPHFLYNTLDTIRIKAALGENDGVINMIELLIQFFRNGLEHSEQIVSIEDELEMVRAYAGIMSYRYPGVDTIFELESDLLGANIPSFILQPLVENCFLHGLKGRCYCGEIHVKLYEKSEGLICITIRNEGEILTQEKMLHIIRCAEGKKTNEEQNVTRRHVGLNNIADRLKLHYPDEHCGMFFSAVPEGGLKVEVVIAKSYQESIDKGVNTDALCEEGTIL